MPGNEPRRSSGLGHPSLWRAESMWMYRQVADHAPGTRFTWNLCFLSFLSFVDLLCLLALPQSHCGEVCSVNRCTEHRLLQSWECYKKGFGFGKSSLNTNSLSSLPPYYMAVLVEVTVAIMKHLDQKQVWRKGFI